MRKVGTFLCGIAVAVFLTGCGSTMPELTQEETDLISEYAVGILLKYDKKHSSRLVDTTAYDIVEEETPEDQPAEELEQEPEEETPVDDSEVVDVSEDEEIEEIPATIEEYYGIQDFTFQYAGYQLEQSYPPGADDSDMFFAMDATEGTQLLVLRFTATNVSGSDQTLNMLGYGARFRVSVNGGSSQGALATMLLNDLQTYNEVVPAGTGVELVSIVEVPQSDPVETIEFILRGGDENVTLVLQ